MKIIDFLGFDASAKGGPRHVLGSEMVFLLQINGDKKVPHDIWGTCALWYLPLGASKPKNQVLDRRQGAQARSLVDLEKFRIGAKNRLSTSTSEVGGAGYWGRKW